MRKHRHYQKIMAKAENMDLVVLFKTGNRWERVVEVAQKWLSFSEEYDYFVCLPQHEAACLHWLNGGTSLFKHPETGKERETIGGEPVWSRCHAFMSDAESSRIKPETEERWIAYSNGSLGVESFDTEEEARRRYDVPINKIPQFIKITVEKD